MFDTGASNSGADDAAGVNCRTDKLPSAFCVMIGMLSAGNDGGAGVDKNVGADAGAGASGAASTGAGAGAGP